MTGAPGGQPLLLGCGILRKEIAHLLAKNRFEVDTAFLDSSLHVNFGKLERALAGALAHHAGRGPVVFYGTCHPRIDGMIASAGATRTPGQNCIEILLGKESFTEELAAGAFFLLEDWAKRWDEIVVQSFGGDANVTRRIFHDDRKYLLGLRTPCSGDYRRAAEAISTSIAMPLRWRDVSLDRMEEVLLVALRKRMEVAP